MSQMNFIADGNVAPSVFATRSSSLDDAVKQGVGGDIVMGITQEWTEVAQISGAATYAAASGDPVKVYQQDDICLLQAGTAGWTHGDLLQPSTGGIGVTASSGYYGAVALETVTASALGHVKIQIGKI